MKIAIGSKTGLIRSFLKQSFWPAEIVPLVMACAWLAVLPAAKSQEPDIAKAAAKSSDLPGQTDVASARADTVADAVVPQSRPQTTSRGEAQLQFAFEGTPWRTVLNWLADEADLALHLSSVPAGSFTYADPHPYSPMEAIERVNLFLIPNGYIVVRSEQLMSVINMSDSRSLQQLDAMARVIRVEELADCGPYDVVKCIFPLGRVEPSVATREISEIGLMSEPVVLPSSNQLVAIETARKLKLVENILASLERPLVDDNVVRSFRLQHVDLEELLSVARPHLGLDVGQTTNGDINISSDSSGKNLIVTGTEVEIELLSRLIDTIDQGQPASRQAAEAGDVLRSHRVEGDNLETVYDVLQTLLVGQSIRLSKEQATNSVVALADEAVHQQIDATIRELAGSSPKFAVIELKTLDPYFAITLLTEMLELPEVDEDLGDLPASRRPPKIDADPTNMRLFVRGTPEQIEEITQVVSELDGRSKKQSDTRTIPLFGLKATEVLQAAEQNWHGDNPLVVLPARGDRPEILERVVNNPAATADRTDATGQLVGPNTLEAKRPTSLPASFVSATSDTGDSSPEENGKRPPSDSGEAKHGGGRDSVSASEQDNASQQWTMASRLKNASSQSPPIQGQITSRGIVIQSDDIDALNEFEDTLRAIGAASETSEMQTVVYYLKYANADDATRLLADLLDGTISVADQSSTAKLVNGYVPGSGSNGYMTFLRKGDDSMMVSAGSSTIISDARLNRLICLGTRDDIQLIEQYLQVIDKATSITSIETRGKSVVIDLQYTRADEVADAVRDAYIGRIAQTNSQRQQAERQQQSQQQSRSERGGSERGADEKSQKVQTSRSSEPEMTVAVHEASNSLIVTAPQQLLGEVEALIRSIDERGQSAVEVVSLPNAGYVQAALKEVLTEKSRSSRSSRN